MSKTNKLNIGKQLVLGALMVLAAGAPQKANAYTTDHQAETYYGSTNDCMAPGYCNDGLKECDEALNAIEPLFESDHFSLRAKCERGYFQGKDGAGYNTALKLRYETEMGVGEYDLKDLVLARNLCESARVVMNRLSDSATSVEATCTPISGTPHSRLSTHLKDFYKCGPFGICVLQR